MRSVVMYPQDLRYSTEHEWAKVEGGKIRVGITKFAADKLTDVVFVELPEVGAKVKFMQPFGVVESVKAVSDLYAPVTGTVVEVNTKLVDTPEVVNTDPHGRGWMIVVKPDDANELNTLMTAEQYARMIGESA
ncbi:MAG: glycine cleavage system protein GcvH [Armatimonadetes bacterium]|nr:glycine cleavage system protein GcvH [Armatimonadota bacterium]